MIEQVDIETCSVLHQLRYFGDAKSIIINGETLIATDTTRKERDPIQRAFIPSLHDVSDWLRKKKKIDIRIECRPKDSQKKRVQRQSLWTYSFVIKTDTTYVEGERCFNEYGGALNYAIKHALTFVQA